MPEGLNEPKKKAHRLSMRFCHLKRAKQTSVKNNSYKSPTKFLQNCRRLDMANNLRPEATRGGFAAPQPIAVSRKQMFIPVHAKRGGFTAPVSAFARKQPLRGTHRQSYKVSSYPYCVLNGCDYRICIMKARTFSAHSPTSERNAPLPSNLMREIFEPGVANGKFWTGFTGLTGFFSLNLVNPVAV